MKLERPSGAVDQTDVRQANLALVLQCVAEAGHCSRAAVAAASGLTRGTVSSLVAELIELDLLRETGSRLGEGRVGRPGQGVELDDTVVAVGLEANVDYVAAYVEDLAGGVLLDRRVQRDNRGSTPGPVLDELARLASDAFAELSAAHRRIAGVGLAVPGLVDPDGLLRFAPNLDWLEVDLGAELAQRIGHPVQVDNEANLAAVAEHRNGAARGIDDFICVFGEVGVGAGVMIGGRLYRGTNGFAGELGHVPVEIDGADCACGSAGCLETRVGVEAIARAAGLETGETRTVMLADELADRAGRGEHAVLEAVREAGRWLATGLVAAFNLFDLSAVVLGGCLGRLSPWLAREVEDGLRARSLAARSASLAVIPSILGEGAPVRGAAAVSLRRVLDAPSTPVPFRLAAVSAR